MSLAKRAKSPCTCRTRTEPNFALMLCSVAVTSPSLDCPRMMSDMPVISKSACFTSMRCLLSSVMA